MTKLSYRQQVGRGLRTMDGKEKGLKLTFSPKVELFNIKVVSCEYSKAAAEMSAVCDLHSLTIITYWIPFLHTNEEGRKAFKKACRAWLYDHQSELFVLYKTP